MNRILALFLLSALCVPAQASTLDLICVGQKKNLSTKEWSENWNKVIRIDMEKEVLVEYESIWIKVREPREIAIALEIDEATIVIIDRYRRPDKGWYGEIVTIQRADGSFDVKSPLAGPIVRGRCKKQEDRAF